MGRLDGKVAIITGSTSGMGRDTAYLFAKEGAKVVVTGRNEERAKAAVEKIRNDGGEAIYVIADTSDRSAAKKIYDETMKAYGTVDILINNAGNCPGCGNAAGDGLSTSLRWPELPQNGVRSPTVPVNLPWSA